MRRTNVLLQVDPTADQDQADQVNHLEAQAANRAEAKVEAANQVRAANPVVEAVNPVAEAIQVEVTREEATVEVTRAVVQERTCKNCGCTG